MLLTVLYRNGEIMPKHKTLTPSTNVSISLFPIVGIGASAGGLAAFEAFFSGIPSNVNPNMAFILVQHLSPDHESMLVELLSHHTHLSVVEAEDGMKVLPNTVYVIPPRSNMAFKDGFLHLSKFTNQQSKRLPIDFLFHSLAQDQHDRAIGIILSGTGSDGTQGISEIKKEGGMLIAQAPETTQYEGMPSSAIATGLIDYILSPEQMLTQLMQYAEHSFKNLTGKTFAPSPQSQEMLAKIFMLLRAQVGHDFSQYKPNTISRRIERRLTILHTTDMSDYVTYLEENPAEVEALIRWNHPINGLVAPNHFISLAEETGIIVPIGLWVLQSACAKLKEWEADEHTRSLTIAINVSARQFHQKDFVSLVQKTLKKAVQIQHS